MPATVLEALPARLAVRSERHWIRDTNHTAADQPRAASRQDSRDAEATMSNSSSKRDLQQRGDDESTSEHFHVQLTKHYLRLPEQEMQQKLRKRRTTNGHCNRILSLAFMCWFPHVFVISLTLETHVLFETRIGCEELPTMMFQQIVFSFREEARVTRCHKKFSTKTFLLCSKITQLDRRPAGTLCRPLPKNATTELQDCCLILEKLSKNLSGSKTATCRQ